MTSSDPATSSLDNSSWIHVFGYAVAYERDGPALTEYDYEMYEEEFERDWCRFCEQFEKEEPSTVNQILEELLDDWSKWDDVHSFYEDYDEFFQDMMECAVAYGVEVCGYFVHVEKTNFLYGFIFRKQRKMLTMKTV